MSVDTINATAAAGVDPTRVKVAGSIKQAASSTGASFEYLLATAKMESNFNPKASATTSSARGLFQFIDQTWLGTVKEAGSQLGYGKFADAITRNPSGSYSVSDPADRAAVMKLRDDPDAASSMAGVLTQSNSFKLTGKIGRRPTDAELYMAHFMGVGGAGKLISSAEDSPNANAAQIFPNAAAANRSIFYDRSGSARSVSQVYSVLSSRYASAANSSATRTAMAAVGGDVQRSVAVASAAPSMSIDTAAYLSSFPDSRTVAPVSATSSADFKTASAQPQPIFRSLFQAGERAEPISPAVQELWGSGSSLTSVSVASNAATTSLSGQTPEVRAPGRLDLFSDRNGTFS
ncbi:lytic transglycosylase domain-containing protein [Bradyrhizobium sp. KBS0727]|uniref:transglycosylase SLT domain-containing protein n=1 Tax=unclassified Bradyrhizobium TaxID=2631580 RepID=UPI00110EEABD|nr:MULTISPECIES: transglycosylase SLT domain-containing protein [unclassified Bradyrhizobium]QDW39422.1 lytic transglycosylase domain-containing protein [Bradyrhizobium sp. KBS0725]QDW46025.1 lytic transglycosylase domain-containing protein [Bradyrhizobium sp. KBS0727]